MSKINPKLKSLFSKILNDYIEKKDFNSYLINNNIYSEEETIIGYIIKKGKKIPVYRKIINCGSCSINESIDHNVTNIDSFIVDGYLFLNGQTCPLPWYNNFSEGNYIKIAASKQKIVKEAKNSWNGYVLAILKYTKTTD